MVTRNSSTSAQLHVGTGVGTHASDWVHYNEPEPRETRDVLTVWNFNVANAAIAAARNNAGSLRIAARKYSKITVEKCEKCHKERVPRFAPRNGCLAQGNGEHNWQPRSSWGEPVDVIATLYYDKSGRTTTVSLHRQ